MTQTILALDCATKTGWALYGNGRLIESGVEDFSTRRGESPGTRFLRFRRWMHDVGDHRGLTLLVYELAHHRGGPATELGVGMTTRVQEYAAEIGCECAGIHSATLKKRIGGSGRADKTVMMREAERRWGRVPKDDNEADALCLLSFALEEYGRDYVR